MIPTQGLVGGQIVILMDERTVQPINLSMKQEMMGVMRPQLPLHMRKDTNLAVKTNTPESSCELLIEGEEVSIL